jgi:hypothetical protein
VGGSGGGGWDKVVGGRAGDGVFKMSITSSFFKNLLLFIR